MALVETLREEWKTRIQSDCAGYSPMVHGGILNWLMGKDESLLNQVDSAHLQVICQGMDFRYRILLQRYLGVSPDRAYRQLMQRLGSLVMVRNKIKAWVAVSRDRQRSVLDVLQEIIQEMLHSDRYMQQQSAWITQCTNNLRLRNALLLTSLEEYCLRPIRNQPLLSFRFVNYLRRTERGGLTQVPAGDLIRIVSEEFSTDEGETTVSLIDYQAVTVYQDGQVWEEQQAQRLTVVSEFITYLEQHVDATAAQWLKLYLNGLSQEAIAHQLGMDIKQVYRLREKVGYHAVNVFAVKVKPELVTQWLGTSVQEHSLGLTPDQWHQYWNSLPPQQQEIIGRLRLGKTFDNIAQELNLKLYQVLREWSRLYLAAQDLRQAS